MHGNQYKIDGEDGYEFFCKRRMATLWCAPSYKDNCPNFGAILSIDEILMSSFQVS